MLVGQGPAERCEGEMGERHLLAEGALREPGSFVPWREAEGRGMTAAVTRGPEVVALNSRSLRGKELQESM